MMKGKQGFTLVELAIVIVVIGILAAIAIPRFLTMQEAAGKAALDANFDALRTVITTAKARTGVYPDDDHFAKGEIYDPTTRRVVGYFFQSPTTSISDRYYSDWMILTSSEDGKIKNATLVGRNRNCPTDYTKYFIVNTVKPGSNRNSVYADVYGAVCYNPNNGDLKKQW